MPDARRTLSSTLPRLLTASLFAASGVALAADPLPSIDGLLVLPNVRVVNAPQPVASTGSGSAVGMRAYVDPDTGQFRQANPEELQQEAAEQPGASQARSARASSSSGPTIVKTASGGTRVYLDESHMQYAVVQRLADGRLVEVCAPGENEALHALHQRAAAIEGEVR